MIYRRRDTLATDLRSGLLKEAVQIDTTAYKKVHGQEPSPSSRGAWVFSAKPTVDFHKDQEGKDYLIAVSLSYTDALKQAREWGKSKTKIYLQESKQEVKESQVAQTIWQQLGANKFAAMTGAKNIVHGPKEIVFSIGRNRSGANKVRIYHNAKDLYNMTFYKLQGVNMTPVKEFEDIYADQLRSVFTKFTGLMTSLSEDATLSKVAESLVPKIPEWAQKTRQLAEESEALQRAKEHLSMLERRKASQVKGTLGIVDYDIDSKIREAKAAVRNLHPKRTNVNLRNQIFQIGE